MKIKAIVFDKDGTLIDYSAFWYPVSRNAMSLCYDKFGVSDENTDGFIKRLGVTVEATDIKGALPRGAHREIFTAMADYIVDLGATAPYGEILSYSIEAFGRISKPYGKVEPTCADMRGVLTRLKEKGIYIALITSDEIVGAKIALESLGVLDLFDEIIAHDGVSPAKPDPYYMNKFSSEHSISKDEIIMVGDTESDILFARNSGTLSIGVGKSKENRDFLSSLGADAVYPDISYIPDFLDRQNGC
jgi:HAD superfamily hydrolase (TIGR01549 family)